MSSLYSVMYVAMPLSSMPVSLLIIPPTHSCAQLLTLVILKASTWSIATAIQIIPISRRETWGSFLQALVIL